MSTSEFDANMLMAFIQNQKKSGKSRLAVKTSLDATIDGFLDMVFNPSE